jgi:hypothetical protein
VNVADVPPWLFHISRGFSRLEGAKIEPEPHHAKRHQQANAAEYYDFPKAVVGGSLFGTCPDENICNRVHGKLLNHCGLDFAERSFLGVLRGMRMRFRTPDKSFRSYVTTKPPRGMEIENGAQAIGPAGQRLR